MIDDNEQEGDQIQNVWLSWTGYGQRSSMIITYQNHLGTYFVPWWSFSVGSSPENQFSRIRHLHIETARQMRAEPVQKFLFQKKRQISYRYILAAS